MTDINGSDRFFNEKQISLILKRASEMQEIEGSTSTDGLSQSELERLAREVGIDPRHIVAAIGEIDLGLGADTSTGFWGGPLVYDMERMVDGEMNEELWERMVTEIRIAMKVSGKMKEWGQSLEWIHSGTSGDQANITVTPRDGKVKIHIFQQFSVLGAAIYVPMTILGLILAGVMTAILSNSVLFGIGIFVSVICVILFLARWILAHLARKEKEKGEQLLKRLAHIVAQGQPIHTSKQIAEGEVNDNR